ncbi:MAG: type VI secretion system-associated FHA domain protein TagH [Gammaproteobacteria bacterium]|nr:type VI secretion system-associated FHA domain protein TagH [Gammaproteobacteria bacterium]MDH5304197.1 type VI secretion system-associated FHA domain protein TagH [Gammaproteobacteria bacterium]MDH5321594.1 type VI secretion system-associated FHA domain protein TagH [Gammaproteobacteria bacterium]
MALQLEIVSEHRELVGDDAVRVFRNKGGTIGRSLQNDWILPDPDRFISGRHATIDFKGGAYYLADTSSNGVYINGDCEPLGKGNPRRLFNGDVIRLGDFVINVSVDEGESLVIPLHDPASDVTDHGASLVDADPLKTGMMLLDEDALTGDAAFQSALFGSQTRTGVAEPEAKAPPAAKPRPAAALEASDLATRELMDAFLDGLGINRRELHPSADLAEVMHNAGEVLREFVEGITQLLASRASFKSAFRLDQTTVLPRQNNALKLSANTADSLRQLLIGKEGEYLGPRDSVREVCRDLLFHQDAFPGAMNSAFLEFSDRFDPEELQVIFDRTLGNGLWAKLTNKYRYWALYGDLYPILTEKGGGRFPQLFAEEFVRAYERQIAEFKRLGGADGHLKATVVLDKQHNITETAPAAGEADEAEA